MQNKKHKKLIAFAVVALLIIIAGIWLAYTNIQIKTTHVSITSEKLPKEFDGFKIAVIADLHNRDCKEKLSDILKEQEPDIIAVVGDLIDSSKTDMDTAVEFIDIANEIAPVYFVSGNHEAWSGEYDKLAQRIEQSGAYVMDNASCTIEKGGAKINLVGLKDPAFSEAENYQTKVFSDQLEKLLSDEYFNIVLSHRPEYFSEYAEADADLVISGHAHGGQVRIPFVGGLIAPGQGFFPSFSEGVYTEDNTSMVVSRGIGNSVVPIRINNTPEVVVITLKQG